MAEGGKHVQRGAENSWLNKEALSKEKSPFSLMQLATLIDLLEINLEPMVFSLLFTLQFFCNIEVLLKMSLL